jgi:hypothetical protein
MSKRLAVVYDSSYVMADKCTDATAIVSDTVFGQEVVESYGGGYGRAGGRGWKIGGGTYLGDGKKLFRIDNFIPSEVVKEIAKHFSSPEKEQMARRARKVLASLLEQGGSEVNLCTVAKPYVSGHSLGADSPTDQLILGYADQLIGDGYDLVIVATDDGGILIDAVMLARAGRPIFCLTKERHSELRERLRVLLGADSTMSKAEYKKRREVLDREKEKLEAGSPGGGGGRY